MDLARLLTRDSDDSDAGHTPTSTQRPVKARAVVRRPSQLEALRDHAQSLEWVVANASVLMGEEQSMDPANNAEMLRIRRFLQRGGKLQAQINQELRVQRGYMEQLRQHRQSAVGIRKLMRGVELDSWFWRCERWRGIATEYYTPFSRVECERLFSETLDMIATYKMPKEIRKDKPSAFGWRDVRALASNRCTVYFQSQKTVCGLNIDTAVGICWEMYQKADLYQFVVGERTQLHFHILQQQILPTGQVLMVQSVEKHAGHSTMVQSLYLVFFMKTETGYIIGMRSIESPDLQRAMQDEYMSNACTFYWASWDVTARDETTGECTEFVARLTGFIGASDPAYAQKWLVEVLIVLVRLDVKLYGTNALPSLDVEIHSMTGQSIPVNLNS